MSKRIALLLDTPEKVVGKTLAKLEDKNGYPSHDSRHIAENIQKVRLKIADLGLDPNDTIAKELYHALLARFEKDSRALEASIGYNGGNFEKKAEAALELVKQNVELPQRWVLKSSAAKAVLRQHPPKKLMKHLGYRSVESLLKRQELGRTFINANLVESATWRKEFSRLISQKDSTAFELRSICLGYLDKEYNLAEDTSALQYNDDIGALFLVKNSLSGGMPLLSIAILLIDGVTTFDSGSPSHLAVLSPVLSWWSDMDGLIAELGGEHISLNIKDVSLSHAAGHDFSQRMMAAGRGSFWQKLLARYENQLEVEEDILADLTRKFTVPKTPLRQPVFEYVEDF